MNRMIHADIWQVAHDAEASGSLPEMRRAYEEVVRQVPAVPAGWLKLSQLCLLEGTYRNGFEAVTRATEAMLSSSRWQALPYVTQQLLMFDERAKVRALVAEADWDAPAVLSQAAVLAQRLWLADDNEQALSLLDHAMARLPSHHLLHFSRGEVLNHLGRLEEAREEYERALAIEPMFPHPHRTLAYNCPDPDPGSRLERIRAALQRAEAADRAEGAIELHYALYKELDHAGRHEEAWHHLAAGAESRRDSQGHDQAGDDDGVAALMAATVGDNGAGVPLAGPAPHVFVVGMPRSGTTVLDRMLGNHRDVHSAGELNAFSRSMSWAMDAFYEPPARRSVVEAAERMDHGMVASRYASATDGYRQGHACLVDKNPVNIHNAGFIARTLPQARILCLVRDPMDACYSNLKELFAHGAYTYSYDLAELAHHYANFRRLAEHWERTCPAHFRTVRYEDLIDRPEQTLASAMRFCGLDYAGGEEDLTRNTAPVSTASRAQVRRPLNRRGIGAWRPYERQLEPLRRRLAEHGLA